MNGPDSNLSISVSENTPLNSYQWNELAASCGNIWQAVFYDQVQLFFNNHAYYFECYSGEKLIGGIKIYGYESKKLPAFIRSVSTRATQISELLIDASAQTNFKNIKEALHSEITNWLKLRNITSFYHYSFYGETEKLFLFSEFRKVWESKIGIAKIDLTKSIDELWKAMNPKHRSEVKKAEKNSVTIEFADDIESFLLLMEETYKNQEGHVPNKNFIRKEYEILKSNNAALLVFSKHHEKYLCGALLYNYGKNSLYNFGGTIKNSIGAGQFLHWEIIKHLKAAGFKNYFLGETSIEKSEANLKFSEGITKFKLRFGAEQLPAQHTGYALQPMKLKAWNLLKKIFVRS